MANNVWERIKKSLGSIGAKRRIEKRINRYIHARDVILKNRELDPQEALKIYTLYTESINTLEQCKERKYYEVVKTFPQNDSDISIRTKDYFKRGVEIERYMNEQLPPIPENDVQERGEQRQEQDFRIPPRRDSLRHERDGRPIQERNVNYENIDPVRGRFVENVNIEPVRGRFVENGNIDPVRGRFVENGNIDPVRGRFVENGNIDPVRGRFVDNGIINPDIREAEIIFDTSSGTISEDYSDISANSDMGYTTSSQASSKGKGPAEDSVSVFSEGSNSIEHNSNDYTYTKSEQEATYSGYANNVNTNDAGSSTSRRNETVPEYNRRKLHIEESPDQSINRSNQRRHSSGIS